MACWFVYVLRCADDSFYTGITRDLSRRLAEHNTNNKSGAAYTRGRRPVQLVYQEQQATRSSATKREYVIRKLSRIEKKALINTANKSLATRNESHET